MPQYKKLSWGLLSTALINRRLIPSIKSSKRNQLTAVGSRDEARARQYAQEWGIPKAHGSYEALLADPEIDIIYNSLPNSLHAEWTIKALQAGKHVLCEKPMTITLEEIDAVAEAAQKAGKIVMEAFMYRHHPQTFQVKELINASTIGELRLVRGAFSFNMLDQPENVRFDQGLGGGCLWDVGCYPVSYARYLAGAEPSEVFGMQEINASNVDIHFVGQLHFPGNIFAQFDSSFSTAFRTHLEVVGTEGTLTIAHPFTPRRRETIKLIHEGKTQNIPIRAPELYSGEVEDMSDAILTGKPPRISIEDSRANIKTLLALYQSAFCGQPISLSLS
jgi:xylose dehydrogenase (NAD/NADP)